MGAWEDGFAAGYEQAIRRYRAADSAGAHNPIDHVDNRAVKRSVSKVKKPRKANAYNKRYGVAFKRLAPKYKKKGGGWKKNGFARCVAASAKAAKK